MANPLKDVIARGDYVLDSFLGSWTTLFAAERTGRRALRMEIPPRYANIAVRRRQAFTRRDAIHVETGLTSVELAATRVVAAPATSPSPSRARADPTASLVSSRAPVPAGAQVATRK